MTKDKIKVEFEELKERPELVTLYKAIKELPQGLQADAIKTALQAVADLERTHSEKKAAADAGRGFEGILTAGEALALWDFWIDLVTVGRMDPKRYNQEFIKEFINANRLQIVSKEPEQLPLTMMFIAFVGGLDMGKEILQDPELNTKL